VDDGIKREMLMIQAIKELNDEFNQLKTESVSAGPAVAILTQLRPVTFEWAKSEDPEISPPPGRQYGLIAQEVEKVLPDFVMIDDRGYKRVNYGSLNMLTIQAIRELSENFNLLKIENETLKTLLNSRDKPLKPGNVKNGV
jgi:hypothetical protein